MKPMRLPLAIAALAAALSAVPALAQDQPSTLLQRAPGDRPAPPTIFVEPVGMMIAAFDSDGDARVTRAEFDAGLKRSFAAVDPTNRGFIGYIAFADWAKRWLGDANALPSPFEVDRNGDNQITFAELQERFAQFFTRFDANKDGVIDRSELLTIRASGFGGERPGGKRGRHEGPPGGQ